MNNEHLIISEQFYSIQGEGSSVGTPAVNFGLHFKVLQYKNITLFFKDTEFMGYLRYLAAMIVIVVITLVVTEHFVWHKVFLNAVFTVVSMSTTTGFTITDFNLWPTFLPFMLMFIAIIGGCGGSTSGGMKIIRCLLLKEQSRRELRRLIHPQAVFSIKLGDQIVSDSILQAVWAYVAFFILTFVVLLLALLATHMNFRTAFGALAACISDTGAGIGGVTNGFENIPVTAKWLLMIAMLVGRLEIFTIFVLFTRSYWRK